MTVMTRNQLANVQAAIMVVLILAAIAYYLFIAIFPRP